MNKSPAFQFYPSDWLSDERVLMMTPAQEGFYIRALCLCWREGSIPADPAALETLLTKGKNVPTETDLRVVQGCFNRDQEFGSRLVHLRLDAERRKQQEWAEKSAQGGKKSAEKRRKSAENGKIIGFSAKSKGG